MKKKMISKKKAGRGGKRIGAGRKPSSPEELDVFCFRLPTTLKLKFKKKYGKAASQRLWEMVAKDLDF